jgi:predicted DNA-binding transcriptional regulator YafY
LRLLGSWAAEAVTLAEIPDADGWRAVMLPVEAIEMSAPMLLGIGPEIEIVAPVELREAVYSLAKQVLSRH